MRSPPTTDLAVGGADALARADALVADGRCLAAIDVLTEANRVQRDPEIERRLVAVRHAAFAEVRAAGATRASASASGTPPVARPRPADRAALPRLDRNHLSAEAVRDSVLRYGCAFIPGLIDRERATEFTDRIDRTFASYDAHHDGAIDDELAPWWQRFPVSDPALDVTRNFARQSGGVQTAESPPNLFFLLEELDAIGLRALLLDYLGERPALTVGKSVLWRVPPDSPGAWHQDGAFLGTGNRTLNLWLTLTDCGVDAPTLEIVPRRLDGIVATGTDGSHFKWSVSQEVAEDAAGGLPLVQLECQAGDALLFDEIFLHRTAATPAMTKPRYAIETWFFAPSVYEAKYLPLVW